MKKRRLVTNAMIVGALLLPFLAACSREHMDWRSAEAADTIKAYAHFIERHPESELVTQARARMVQLTEERDWKRASAADTPLAYQLFLSRHENGKWAEEARIRIESFALDAHSPPGSAADGDEPAMAVPAAAESASASGALAQPAVRRGTSVPPPARPAATAPAAPVAPRGTYGIQLGAFSTQAAALGEWKRLQSRFGADLAGLAAHTVPVTTASGRLFRLQAPVGPETRARAICAALERQSQPCVVVLP